MVWGSVWVAYVVANHTLDELYIGVLKCKATAVEASLLTRWRAHCAGDTATIGHWECAEDDIELVCRSKSATERRASALAHELKREPEELALRCPTASRLVRRMGYAVHRTVRI
jgi:hypothetical protein